MTCKKTCRPIPCVLTIIKMTGVEGLTIGVKSERKVRILPTQGWSLIVKKGKGYNHIVSPNEVNNEKTNKIW